MVYKINPAGDTVVVDTVGSNSDDFDEFLDALPENDCRYCVYDFLYTNADACVFNKIVFVMWTPETARIKSKMLYASSKDTLKVRGAGLRAPSAPSLGRPPDRRRRPTTDQPRRHLARDAGDGRRGD